MISTNIRLNKYEYENYDVLSISFNHYWDSTGKALKYYLISIETTIFPAIFTNTEHKN